MTISTIMKRSVCRVGLLLAISLSVLSLHSAERDRIVLRGNAFPAIVERETSEGIEYRITASQPTTQTKRWSEVVEIQYAGMDSGLYRAGMSAMNAGRYEEAAVRFESLAAAATREWEGAYGFYRLGEAYEAAGDYVEAAGAFANLAVSYPEHRFYMDALYRQGVNLARAGSGDEAKQVIERLNAIRKEDPTVGRAPEFRANAIRAAITAIDGNISEAKRIANTVALAPRDGDTWFHWGSFWAGYLLELGEFRDAAAQYERMLGQVGDNPSQRAQLSLGLGISRARDGAKAEALYELLKLDTMPYGSSAQRAQAQLWGGRLLIERGEANLEAEDSRTVDFGKVMIERGELLLRSAASSISDHPAKVEAARLLEQRQGAAEGAEVMEVEDKQ